MNSLKTLILTADLLWLFLLALEKMYWCKMQLRNLIVLPVYLKYFYIYITEFLYAFGWEKAVEKSVWKLSVKTVTMNWYMLIKSAFFKSLLGVAVLKVIWYYILFSIFVTHSCKKDPVFLEKIKVFMNTCIKAESQSNSFMHTYYN